MRKWHFGPVICVLFCRFSALFCMELRIIRFRKPGVEKDRKIGPGAAAKFLCLFLPGRPGTLLKVPAAPADSAFSGAAEEAQDSSRSSQSRPAPLPTGLHSASMPAAELLSSTLSPIILRVRFRQKNSRHLERRREKFILFYCPDAQTDHSSGNHSSSSQTLADTKPI